MKRDTTAILRWLMDECLPPVLRDSRWFMKPLFMIWFKSRDVDRFMEFKSRFHALTEREYEDLYRSIDCLATDRPSDLTDVSTRFILSALDRSGRTLLDVGCGRGHFMKLAADAGYDVTGCDVLEQVDVPGTRYVQGNIEALPFPDRSFDIVTCHHTIEHVLHLPAAIAELKRVARKQLIVTTPCQRFFRYTLDLHVNFFPLASYLEAAMDMPAFTCTKIRGDWVYVGTMLPPGTDPAGCGAARGE